MLYEWSQKYQDYLCKAWVLQTVLVPPAATFIIVKQGDDLTLSKVMLHFFYNLKKYLFGKQNNLRKIVPKWS